MKTFLSSNLASPTISAVLWIVISLATGASITFALIGGLACFVVVCLIQEGYRRATAARRA